MKHLIVPALVALAALTAPASAAGHPPGQHDLAAVREATTRYHHLANAVADGYVRLSACLVEDGLGGMGYHYGKPALLGAPIDPLQPALLLYAPSGERLRLVAVEYFQVDADQDMASDEDRPSLFGQPFDGPMEGHGGDMPVHYDLHVWLWAANPSGTFAPFNPNVRC